MKRLPIDLLQALFRYEPKLGQLYWRERPLSMFRCDSDCQRWNRRYVGKLAGCISKSTGYRYISYGKTKYEVHRIIWALETGNWPENIDHENGDRSDNRFPKLRNVTHVENTRNQALPKSNTSGVCGVHMYKPTGNWVAVITVNGKKVYLGTYKKKEDAAQARKNAERKYGFHLNHGRKKHDKRSGPQIEAQT